MTTPTVGRFVHYRLPEGHNRAGEIRPAAVVKVWGPTCVNLHVLVDPANDEPLAPEHQCSVTEGDGLRQWSWPPRV